MLYQIASELGQALKAKGVPFPVVFGPEPTAPITGSYERIVFEHPIDEKRDTVTAPRSVHRNPRMPLMRLQAARVRIFARSPLAGARWHDHAERAEEVLDRVLAELDAIVRGRRNVLTYGGGGFVSLVDEKGTQVWSSAIYELDITIDRGVERRTWAGDANEEVSIGAVAAPGVVPIRSTVKVSSDPGPAGTPPPDAETASGG